MCVVVFKMLTLWICGETVELMGSITGFFKMWRREITREMYMHAYREPGKI